MSLYPNFVGWNSNAYTLDAIIDDLEAKGLVQRRVNGADRRARELRATARATGLRRRMRPKVLAAQAGTVSSSYAPVTLNALVSIEATQEALAGVLASLATAMLQMDVSAFGQAALAGGLKITPASTRCTRPSRRTRCRPPSA